MQEAAEKHITKVMVYQTRNGPLEYVEITGQVFQWQVYSVFQENPTTSYSYRVRKHTTATYIVAVQKANKYIGKRRKELVASAELKIGVEEFLLPEHSPSSSDDYALLSREAIGSRLQEAEEERDALHQENSVLREEISELRSSQSLMKQPEKPHKNQGLDLEKGEVSAERFISGVVGPLRAATKCVSCGKRADQHECFLQSAENGKLGYAWHLCDGRRIPAQVVSS